MSQAERHAKQAQRQGQALAAQMQQRSALSPRIIAVSVAAAYGYAQPIWRQRSYSLIALRGAERAGNAGLYDGVVRR